jgi:hypothetical protein
MLDAKHAHYITDRAINGDGRTRLERWLAHIEDMANLGKYSTRIHVFADKKNPAQMTTYEKQQLANLGYRVEYSEEKHAHIIHW